MGNVINDVFKTNYNALQARPWMDESSMGHVSSQPGPGDSQNLKKVVDGNNSTAAPVAEEQRPNMIKWLDDNPFSQVFGRLIALITGGSIMVGIFMVLKASNEPTVTGGPGMTINLMEPKTIWQRLRARLARKGTTTAQPVTENPPTPKGPSVFVGDAELGDFSIENLPKSLFRTGDGAIHVVEFNKAYNLVPRLLGEFGDGLSGAIIAARTDGNLITDDGRFRLHLLKKPITFEADSGVKIEFLPPEPSEEGREHYQISISYSTYRGITYYYDANGSELVRVEAWNWTNTARMDRNPSTGAANSYVIRNLPDMTPDFLRAESLVDPQGGAREAGAPLADLDFSKLLGEGEELQRLDGAEAAQRELHAMLKGGRAKQAFNAVEDGLTAYFEKGLPDAARLERARKGLLEAREVLRVLEETRGEFKKGRDR